MSIPLVRRHQYDRHLRQIKEQHIRSANDSEVGVQRFTMSVFRGIATFLLMAAIVVGGFIPYSLFATHGAAEHAQNVLGRSLGRTALIKSNPKSASAQAPVLAWPKTVSLGTPIAKISVPSAGIRSDVVLQGTDEERLAEGPGHYAASALPGQPGNVAIAGHRTTWLRPFYNLQNTKVGDSITLTVGSDSWRYVVTKVFVVAPTDVSVIAPLKGWWITLTTCNPRYSASQRLVVRARLLNAPTGVGANPPVARVVGLKNPSALIAKTSTLVFVGWALGVALFAIFAIVLARKKKAALILLMPAAMCCFEGYGQLVQLLPNNL